MNFLVWINCSTFNHASYIEDAMNGFCMQETTFPFVCTILDDASTDGEPEVIKKYLLEHFDLDNKDVVRNEETDDYVMTFAQHKKNKNCFFAVYFLKYNHYSINKKKIQYIQEWIKQAKYVAWCEGDDYWVHPRKLQQQVGIMTNDDNIGLVYTKSILLNQITGKTIERSLSPKIKLDENFKWRIIDQSVLIDTNTTIMRSELYQNIRSIKEDFEGFLMGDTQLWFHSARLSKVAYIPEVMGVYRKQPIGATGVFDQKKRIRFLNSCLNLDLHLAYKYGAPKETIRTIKKRFFVQIYSLYIKNQDFVSAQQFSKVIVNNAWLLKPYLFFARITGFFSSGFFVKTFEYMVRIRILKIRD